MHVSVLSRAADGGRPAALAAAGRERENASAEAQASEAAERKRKEALAAERREGETKAKEEDKVRRLMERLRREGACPFFCVSICTYVLAKQVKRVPFNRRRGRSAGMCQYLYFCTSKASTKVQILTQSWYKEEARRRAVEQEEEKRLAVLEKIKCLDEKRRRPESATKRAGGGFILSFTGDGGSKRTAWQ